MATQMQYAREGKITDAMSLVAEARKVLDWDAQLDLPSIRSVREDAAKRETMWVKVPAPCARRLLRGRNHPEVFR